MRSHVRHIFKALKSACEQAQEIAQEDATPDYDKRALSKRQRDVIDGTLLPF